MAEIYKLILLLFISGVSFGQISMPKIEEKPGYFTIDDYLAADTTSAVKDSMWFQTLDHYYHQKDTTHWKSVCAQCRKMARNRYTNAQFEHAFTFYIYKYNIEFKNKDPRGMGRTLSSMSHLQYRMGNFMKSVNLSREGINKSTLAKDSTGIANNIYHLSWAYCKLQRPDEAIQLIEDYKTIQHKIAKNKKYLNLYYNSLAAFLNVKKQYALARHMCDSAIHYACYLLDDQSYGIALSNKANYYPEGNQDDLDQRLAWINEAIAINVRQKDKEQWGSNLIIKGKLYQISGNCQLAIQTFRKSLDITTEIGDKVRTHLGYKGLGECYQKTGNAKEAVKYLQKELLLYEELYGLSEVNKIFDLEKKYEAAITKNTINRLHFDKEMAEMKSKNQLQQYFIFLTLLIFISLIYATFAYRKKEKERLEKRIMIEETKSRISQLEKQALASQMNPHFIFNSLNAIKNYIINNEARHATQFINNFAALIRKTLDYSHHNTISLKEEIDTLTLYLSVEKKRFNDQFTYEMIMPDQALMLKIQVPPFILQPLVENAIWHGLMHKKGEKNIEIEIKLTPDKLLLIVRDDGIGIQKAKEIKSKQSNLDKSYGFDISAKRLHQHYGEDARLELTENNTGGATSTISISRSKISYE